MTGIVSRVIAAVVFITIITKHYAHAKVRNILVLGGNGFIGASTVDKLVEDGDHVIILNRGNWYWDSQTRILPRVEHIKCDRSELDRCAGLQTLLSAPEKLDAVIDFSGYNGPDVVKACEVLKGKVALYIYISTDSVYDVCDKNHDGHSKETDSVRPESQEEVKRRSHYHQYGHSKLEAEEVLLQQRMEGGFPFVLLRLPDVVGPRDTTYRWWIYQLWVKLAPHIKERRLTIPHFLESYPISFVYVEDVARVVVDILGWGPQILDQAINLANPDTVEVLQLITDIRLALGIEQDDFIHIQDPQETNHLFFYPTVRRGPLDVSKAQSLLLWEPTPWKDMVVETVNFYEVAMKDESFRQQRDEIIQVVATQLYAENVTRFYEALEKVYSIDLHHFTKHTRDEL